MNTYRKKLIEVALPLEAINAACVEDKNRKTGHIRNLHKWFAPMPLPAWRAMLAATVLDDPSNDFPEAEAIHRRALLFDLIRDLAPIDAYRDKALMERARAAIYEACNGELPCVVDPFCGGGSTIVEAQRLGLPTIASDLNPIPVLITTALCRVPQLFRDRAPVSDARATAVDWRGADGLIADVRHYAGLVHDRAQSKLKDQYPPLPDRSVPYAWRWAWSVASPNPAARGAYVPLVSDWLLSKHRGRAVWVKAHVDAEECTIRYSIERDGSPPKGNVGRGGAKCLYTGTPIPLDHIRLEGQAQRLKVTLLAVAVQRGDVRDFVAGGDVALPTSAKHPIEGIPIHPGALGFRVQAYGVTDYRDLYTARQSQALFTFAQEIDGVHSDIIGDARRYLAKNETSLEDGGEGATAYADAVCATLGLLLGKMAQSNNVLVRWFIDPRNGSGKATPSFERNAVPMVWDFVETNPFGGATGDWAGAVQETGLRAFELVAPNGPPSRVFQEDVRKVAARYPSKVVVACDPPYYDNIGYADLSDVFFLWLRPALRRTFPRLFGTLATPKEAELIASPGRRGGPEPAREYFREGFTEAFERLATAASSDFPISIVYALKQTEGDTDSGGSIATGWDLFLSGLLDAGLAVVATWPVRTTTDTRMRGFESNALASAIFVVCRRRPENAPTATRGEFRRILRKELPDALKKLQQGNIAPVDVAQASIGPGMAIFSRHKQVVEADGTSMSVRAALQLINEVLDEYLASGEGDFDADTRFAITWYEQHGWEVGAFGEAESIAKARNISVQGVVEAGICHSGAGKVRLIKRQELPTEYDLAADERPTVWEFTQHMIRYLEEQGEEAAARLMKRLGARADATRDLAYRLYNTCERKKWAEDARSYNGLILAWPELEKLAARMTDESPVSSPGKADKKGKKSKTVTRGQQDLFRGGNK
jgi:putative DNA methylase